jgi:hypothetical protein
VVARGELRISTVLTSEKHRLDELFPGDVWLLTKPTAACAICSDRCIEHAAIGQRLSIEVKRKGLPGADTNLAILLTGESRLH